MKVILQRDIPKLGKGGEVVNVADGYARNYLFPRGHAVPATGGFLKHHQARIEHERTLGDKLHADAESNARKLDGLTVVITGKVGSGTKLYGSVTAQDVADAISFKLNEAERHSKADDACGKAFYPQIGVGLGWVEVCKGDDPFGFPY